MTITYALVLPPYGNHQIEQLFRLSLAVFGEADLDHVRWRLTRMPDLSTFTAHAGDSLIGFKTGYAMSEVRYYSWLGGVRVYPRTTQVLYAKALS